jgi:hypothetical protein
MNAEEIFDVYINTLALLAILIVPASFYCVVKAWQFVRRYHGYKLPLVIAVVNSLAFPIAAYVGFLSWLRLQGGEAPVWTPPISALAFVMLDFIPLITTGYLIWLDGHRPTTDRRSKPGE